MARVRRTVRPPQFHAESQAYHFPVHSGRTVACGFIRPQAEAQRTRRPVHPDRITQKPSAVRADPRDAKVARITLYVSKTRPIRHDPLRVTTPSFQSGRRTHRHPLDAHRYERPRSRRELHELRHPAWRPTHAWRVAFLRPRIGKQRPARLHRTHFRSERRPATAPKLLGSWVSRFAPRRRPFPQRRRARTPPE